MAEDTKRTFAEKMRAQFPDSLDDKGVYTVGVSERYEDLLSIGNTRDLSIWRETHERLKNFKHMAEYEFLPTYSQLHESFIEEIFCYCHDRSIDIQFHSAPCNIFFNRDYSEKYAIGVRTLSVHISPELPLENQGRLLAYGVMDRLSKRRPDWDLLTLYCISARKEENLCVRFGGVDTKNPLLF